MPDDSTRPDRPAAASDWEAVIPPTLMAVGAASLVRSFPLLSLALVGGWLFRLATEADQDRHVRGRSLGARRAAAHRLDVALEDSFPASDPPSLSGITS